MLNTNFRSFEIILIAIIIIELYVLFIVPSFYSNGDSCSTESSQNITIKSMNPSKKEYDYLLRDFRIKASFNSCAYDNFHNTHVKLCALENVIKSGARFLDFEIYNRRQEPVISVSNVEDFDRKYTFNELSFSKTMQYIKDHCFERTYVNCPNPDDPLLLHFRIRSNENIICDKMSKTLRSVFGDQNLLGANFSYGTHARNLGTIPIKALCKNGKYKGEKNTNPKVIIIVDKNTNKVFESTKLFEDVNMESGGPFLQILRDTDIRNAPSQDELKEKNKTNMTIAIPDAIPEDAGDLASMDCCVPRSNNIDYNRNFALGCQIVTMCYQNMDKRLKDYTEYFNKQGSAFVLKPENLRHVPITISKPTPQKKENSFAKRTVSSDFFSFNI